MKGILGKMNDGGPVFTYTILILLLVIIALFIIALVNRESEKKMSSLIASIAWFALAWGYLGRTFGLIMAFDNIAASGQITPEMMAGGLKMALVDPLMGLITFIVARAGIIVLTVIRKREEV